jgi:hypothetical protein
MLAPPPEPGRTGTWNHRGDDPATGALPLGPGSGEAPAPADRTWNSPERSWAPAPDAEQVQRSRRRPPVIDLGAAEGPNRTPFG